MTRQEFDKWCDAFCLELLGDDGDITFLTGSEESPGWFGDLAPFCLVDAVAAVFYFSRKTSRFDAPKKLLPKMLAFMRERQARRLKRDNRPMAGARGAVGADTESGTALRTPTVENPLIVLALGAGVQSSYLHLASDAGELPRIDVSIFSDTRDEPKDVYDHLDWMEKTTSIPIIRVSVGDLRQDAIDFRQDRVSRDGKRWASVPFYVKNTDGSRGQIRRQCTPTYKIEPMERVIREQLLGLKRGQRSQPVPLIEQWIGISSDEGQRCSFPGVYTTKKIKISKDLWGGNRDQGKNVATVAVEVACLSIVPDTVLVGPESRKIRSTNPGYCFIKAGWRKCGRTKSGKMILEKVATSGSGG